MRPQELADQCAENINFYTLNGMPAEEASVMITTPRSWKAPPKFPRSEIVQVTRDGERVRRLPAMRLLAWLVAHGLAKVEIKLMGETP